ncbi:MAG: hypothetical protein KKD29_02565, partial [Candidatus Omnitrophica bacterium]|nr:hypothetical protein [Candidatus Omnitrophota bacterium]
MKNIKFIFLTLLIISSAVFLHTQDALATFSINLNFYSIDFGNLNMGDIKDDVPGIGLKVTCQTDQGNPWQLRIRAERPLTSILNP